MVVFCSARRGSPAAPRPPFPGPGRRWARQSERISGLRARAPGDRPPAAAAAGELVGVMPRPVGQTHLGQQRPSLLLDLSEDALLLPLKSGRSRARSWPARVTFSSAVYWGKRLKFWNTRPKWRRFFRTSLSRWVAGSAASHMVSPFTRMTPVSGRSRKFRQRSSVVLPEPDEPMTQALSFWRWPDFWDGWT